MTEQVEYQIRTLCEALHELCKQVDEGDEGDIAIARGQALIVLEGAGLVSVPLKA